MRICLDVILYMESLYVCMYDIIYLYIYTHIQIYTWWLTPERTTRIMIPVISGAEVWPISPRLRAAEHGGRADVQGKPWEKYGKTTA